MTVEPLAQAILGFRRWRVVGSTLAPVHFDAADIWAPGRVAVAAHGPGRRCAETEMQAYGAPGRQCNCGLYGLYHVESPSGGTVTGAIAAWGRIVEAERGFRAQFARVIGIWDAYPGQRRTRRVAERYEVPLLPLSELMDYMGWWGDAERLAVPAGVSKWWPPPSDTPAREAA